MRSCGRCEAAAGQVQVVSWHRAADGFVGYARCTCGGWLIVRPR